LKLWKSRYLAPDSAAGCQACSGAFVFEDAVYYSRREAEERRLAAQTADPRVERVHRALAEQYSQLAHRMMAKLDGVHDN
jgi:hypothetical protein